MKRFAIKGMGKKQYLFIGAVVLLAVVLVVGALLIQRAGGDEESDTGGLVTTTDAGGSSTGTVSDPLGGSSVAVPQTDEVALGQVNDPPEHTLAYVSADDYSADSDYLVTFVPYGTTGRPSTLIISIIASRPRGDVDKPFEFEGRNALVDTSLLAPGTAVTTGGTYTGILRLVKQESGLSEGGVLAPVLVEAARAE